MATTTVNISLPTNLKKEADFLVAAGDYASFSDFMRTAARLALKEKYKSMIEETKRDVALGLTKVLKSKEDIDNFIDSLGK
jgi:Arc/MetJ-type ribon-helix-helix transcriptional regulator